MVRDFHLTMRLRNNKLRASRLALGLTPSELSEAVGIRYGAYLELEGLKASPLRRNGTWRLIAQRLAEFYRIPEGDLFTDAVLSVTDPEQTATLEAEQLALLAGLAGEVPELPPTPEELVSRKETESLIREKLAELAPREADVLIRRGIITGYPEETFREIGARYGVRPQTARQIYQTAARRLVSLVQNVDGSVEEEWKRLNERNGREWRAYWDSMGCWDADH